MLRFLTCILTEPDASWLNIVNILLGAASIICLLLIVGVVVEELISRHYGRKGLLTRRLRSISLRQLGFDSTDSKALPDEKDLHPGVIPGGKSENEIHSR